MQETPADPPGGEGGLGVSVHFPKYSISINIHELPHFHFPWSCLAFLAPRDYALVNPVPPTTFPKNARPRVNVLVA